MTDAQKAEREEASLKAMSNSTRESLAAEALNSIVPDGGMSERAEAWDAVAAALHDVCPGWHRMGQTAMAAAVAQIRALAAAAAPVAQGEPVAWVRFCSDGCIEGPVLHSRMEEVRKRSGAWTPLYAAPASPAGAEREALRIVDELEAVLSTLHPEQVPYGPVLERLRAALSQVDALAQQPETASGWEHLKPYGFAPGNYIAQQAAQQVAAEPAPSGKVSKWIPTTNLMMLRRMGKMSEELGELQAVTARVIIQGIDEVDPSSGKVNRQRLQDEMADVNAQLQVTAVALGLDTLAMNARTCQKIGYMNEWEAMFADEATQPPAQPAGDQHQESSIHAGLRPTGADPISTPSTPARDVALSEVRPSRVHILRDKSDPVGEMWLLDATGAPLGDTGPILVPQAWHMALRDEKDAIESRLSQPKGRV